MGSPFFLGVFHVLAMAVRPARGWRVLPNVIITFLWSFQEDVVEDPGMTVC